MFDSLKKKSRMTHPGIVASVPGRETRLVRVQDHVNNILEGRKGWGMAVRARAMVVVVSYVISSLAPKHPWGARGHKTREALSTSLKGTWYGGVKLVRMVSGGRRGCDEDRQRQGRTNAIIGYRQCCRRGDMCVCVDQDQLSADSSVQALLLHIVHIN